MLYFRKLTQCLALLLISVPLVLHGAAASETLHDKIEAAIDNDDLKGLHSVLMLRDGNTLFEGYFEGEDERWGQPIGLRAHGPQTRHDLRSVTKSIVGLLYAIARDKNLVPPPQASLFAQFAEYPDLAADAKRKAIRIEHALTMTMGTAWDETLPYTDPENSEIAMELAPDRYRFILEREVVSKPGDRWNYSGGATALIGRVIAKGAGMALDEFAKVHLFDPLDIEAVTWIKGRDGEPSAASGLRMRAPDLAKIGQLLVDGGIYNGKRIISEAQIGELLHPRITIDMNFHYGHFWYLLGAFDSPAVAAGFGNGGQRLSINLNQNLVSVVFAGNYNDPNAWRISLRVLEDYLVPALLGR